MRENTDQNNSEYGHFSRSANLTLINTFILNGSINIEDFPFNRSYKF